MPLPHIPDKETGRHWSVGAASGHPATFPRKGTVARLTTINVAIQILRPLLREECNECDFALCVVWVLRRKLSWCPRPVVVRMCPP